MKDIYNAIVIGCGSIGALKPDEIDGPSKPFALTHAAALSKNPRVALRYVVDADPKRALLAGDKWGRPSAHTLAGRLKDCVDIAVITTPTSEHLKTFIDLMRSNILTPARSVVVFEKPCGLNRLQAEAFLNDLVRRDELETGGGFVIPVVNYTRRFDETVKQIRADIMTGDSGRVFHARFTYGRGWMRDGCHALDMARFLFGNMHGGFLIGEPIQDGPEDPTWTAHASFDMCPSVLFVGTDSRHYSVFDFDMYSEAGRTQLMENGLLRTDHVPLPEMVYSNGAYKRLPGSSDPAYTTPTSLHLALENLTAECVQILDEERYSPSCSIQDAIEVHRMIESLRLVVGTK